MEEYYTTSESLNITDQYGNNTNFPISILSNISKKGLLGKWTSIIINNVCHCLYEYHMKKGNTVAGDKDYVSQRFREIKVQINFLTPVLEDLVNDHIYGIEDICIAVYGVGSDEVYALRRFLALSQRIDDWDTDYMWDDCIGDKRLKNILKN